MSGFQDHFAPQAPHYATFRPRYTPELIAAVAALDRVVLKFRRGGTEVELIGLNKPSATLVDKLAIHDKPGASAAPAPH